MNARTAHFGRISLAGTLAAPTGWISRIRHAWTQYRAYRATFAEMQALTDRDLADIGLSRPMVREIAHRAIYGK